MSPDSGPEGGSLFASIRGLGAEEKTAPAPAPTPPPQSLPTAQPPAPSLQPLLERLERIESGLADARKHDPASRIAELEKQLKATQEQAVGALVTLREREEAQKAAQRDMETMLHGLAAQRRSEEIDRQMRERIADLENRLLSMGKAEPPPPDPALMRRLEALEAEAARSSALLRETATRALEQAREDFRADALALQRRVRTQFEESEVAAAKTRGGLDALRDAVEKLREELSRGETREEASQKDSRRAQLGLESLRASVEKLRQDQAAAGASAGENISQLRAELSTKQSQRDARVEELAVALSGLMRELGDLRSKEEARLEEIRGGLEATAETKLKELGARVEDSLGEGLLGVRSRLDGIDGELQKAERARTMLAETTARLELFRGEAEKRRGDLAKTLESFQSEVRSVILGRLLRLERSLFGRGQDA